MKQCLQIARKGMALLVLSWLGAGCVTHALWEEKSFHAADEPRLNLSLVPPANDILVEYVEQYGETAKTRPRAYWLFAYTLRQKEKTKPAFVHPDATLERVPVPLLRGLEGTNSLPAGYCALPLAYDQGFYLWKDGQQVGRFDLPIYFARPRATAGRIALTPLAVAADVVIVGTVVGAVVTIIYLESLPDSNDL